MTETEARALHRGLVIPLPPNRVWRTYPGGATLDRLAGRPDPRDGSFPEDWIGSVTTAVSPGREHIREGRSQVAIDGRVLDLEELFQSDPIYFFGARHVAAFGARPMMLVKFLDSAIRLHVQAHPSREFARRRLGSSSGKTEAYYVLGARENVTGPHVFIGFQRPPTRERLREIITTQDVAALEQCFDKIPVKPGDVLLVPGGMPHALGEGLFLIEIQEPSDLVVRLEFERGGCVLPEAARFMGRGVEFALDLLDLARHPVEEIDALARCAPRHRRSLGAGRSHEEELIGPEQTPCFGLRQWRLEERVAIESDGFRIIIVTRGRCHISTANSRLLAQPFDKFIMPAGLGRVVFEPESSTDIVACHPPQPG